MLFTLRMLSHDVLYCIALEINDKLTWYAFALCNRAAASVVRKITQMKSRNVDFERRKHHSFFHMPLESPLQEIPVAITIGGPYIYVVASGGLGQWQPYPSSSYPASWGNGQMSYVTTGEGGQYAGTFLWNTDRDTVQLHPNGHRVFMIRASGRLGEGIQFDNGASGKMHTKKYNDQCVWKYVPKNPDHWKKPAPTSTAEAIDRLAEQLYLLNGKLH